MRRGLRLSARMRHPDARRTYLRAFYECKAEVGGASALHPADKVHLVCMAAALEICYSCGDKKADGAAGEYAFRAVSGTGRLYLTFDLDKDFLCTLDFPIILMSS